MQDIRTYTTFPSNLSLPEAFAESEKVIRSQGYHEFAADRKRTQSTCIIDETRRIRTSTWAEFMKILERFPKSKRQSIYSYWTSESRPELGLGVDISSLEIEITVASTDEAIIELLHSRLQECFRATNLKPDKSPHLQHRRCKKTAFLAHRFDDKGKQSAAVLKTFLLRCGFHVVEGEGYEARQIPLKIEQRILGQDILIALVTPGDLSWIFTEATFAHAHEKYVLFLVEDGITPKKGIIGADYEHLEFPVGNIEKSFSDLLYALPM